MTQKDAFLEGEGDAWFERNRRQDVRDDFPQTDRLLAELLRLSPPEAAGPVDLLEIGCGEGVRLGWLAEHLRWRCSGIDPSLRAVEAARLRGVDARNGTADVLPFEDAAFDIVVFGFCLYVCDRRDLFRIACEADRVLRAPGWLVILDFHSPSPMRRPYHHRAGLFSHKMDYRSMFIWHPDYTSYSHTVRDHLSGAYTDDPQEWTAVSVLRKAEIRT